MRSRGNERCRAASRRELRPHRGQRSGEAASVGGPYKRRRRAPRRELRALGGQRSGGRPVSGVTSQYPALLETLAPAVDRRMETLAPIERAVIVIGAWELSHRLDIPYRVVIDEAVEIAKSYGGTDGHKFVNGVLDKLAPRLRAGETRASGNP